MRRLILAPRWLQFFIVVLLLFGVFFRFVNLDRKVYSPGEIDTLLRISGYTSTQVKQQLFNGRVIDKQAFAKFQSLNPEKKLGDTIKSLAIDNPRHPPLYYLLVRFWVQFFGDSITTIRSLSAVISLSVFPCAYWLCRELFKVPLSLPGIAIALLAISPIQIIYAQEAQEYILWEVTILLSSAALLRVLRLESTQLKEESYILNWGIYTFTLVLSLYTFLLSGFVAITHLCYVIAIAKFRWNQIFQRFLISSLLGFFIFSPWILVILANQSSVLFSTEAKIQTLSFPNSIVYWLIQTNHIFIDVNFNWLKPLSLIVVTPIFFALVGYALYCLWRTNHEKTWLFITSLISIPTIPLLVSFRQLDIIPYYLGVQIAVAYLLAIQLYNGSISRQKTWQTILAVLIIVGLFSDTLYSQSYTWWSKFSGNNHLEIANIINQAPRPLLISSDAGNNSISILTLSSLVEQNVLFLLVQGNNIPKFSKNYSNIFLLNPSDTLRKRIEKKYQMNISIIYHGEYSSLWKLSK
ncbi:MULTISPECIES: glycosyltransferase family 39 protein [Fischerella]|nr:MULTISPECIES: glycosyltransferase family 39 protein [Fischerella]MBD2429905.1 glycosyltransferase family 39 protein [Fischerella sp. FACHB-380]